MIKTAICDDNALYREMLKDKIYSILPQPAEVFEFSSAEDFLSALEKNPRSFGLAVLDIDLGADSLSGIALAEKINVLSPHTQIIYISQYLEFAPDVYRTKHVWFINKNRLEPFLQKAMSAALENLKKQASQFLLIKTRQTRCCIPVRDILFLERNLHETKIYTNARVFITREKLTTIMEELPPTFVICHRSFAVNLKAVSSLERSGLILSGGKALPVSRSRYEEVKKAFSQMLID